MKLKIVIGIVVVALAVVGVVLLTGGDDNDTSTKAKNEPSKSDAKPTGSDSNSGSDSDSDAGSGDVPALRTLAVKRAEGKDAAVTVGSLIRSPKEVWLRVSSAPKQKVTINWTLACGGDATAQGDYDVTPPDTRQIEIPGKNPKTCSASASTQIDGDGRVKLAVMRDR